MEETNGLFNPSPEMKKGKSALGVIGTILAIVAIALSAISIYLSFGEAQKVKLATKTADVAKKQVEELRKEVENLKKEEKDPNELDEMDNTNTSNLKPSNTNTSNNEEEAKPLDEAALALYKISQDYKKNKTKYLDSQEQFKVTTLKSEFLKDKKIQTLRTKGDWRMDIEGSEIVVEYKEKNPEPGIKGKEKLAITVETNGLKIFHVVESLDGKPENEKRTSLNEELEKNGKVNTSNKPANQGNTEINVTPANN